jgi:DivIVA domain-containing protein
MAYTPDEIEGREFGLSRRGYDRDEVDEFLVEVAETVREDLDQAVARLDPEATAAEAETAIEQASAIDPTDTPVSDLDDGGEPEPRLGQGPPTPPVPPPPSPPDGDEFADEDAADAVVDLTDEPEDARDEGAGDLPYADEDEPLDDPTAGEAGDDAIPPVPPPPPPPPGYGSAGSGDAADDLPYASDDDEDEGDDADDRSEDEPTIDLRDGVPDEGDESAEGAEPDKGDEGDEEDEGDEGDEEDEDGDPLASMVRDAVGKAVKGATRRRPGKDS